MEDPEPPAQGLTTSLINMKEVFYLTKRDLFQNPDGVARQFYQQAYRPGFKTKAMALIEKEALSIIRDCLLKNRVQHQALQRKAYPERHHSLFARDLG